MDLVDSFIQQNLEAFTNSFKEKDDKKEIINEEKEGSLSLSPIKASDKENKCAKIIQKNWKLFQFKQQLCKLFNKNLKLYKYKNINISLHNLINITLNDYDIEYGKNNNTYNILAYNKHEIYSKIESIVIRNILYFNKKNLINKIFVKQNKLKQNKNDINLKNELYFLKNQLYISIFNININELKPIKLFPKKENIFYQQNTPNINIIRQKLRQLRINKDQKKRKSKIENFDKMRKSYKNIKPKINSFNKKLDQNKKIFNKNINIGNNKNNKYNNDYYYFLKKNNKVGKIKKNVIKKSIKNVSDQDSFNDDYELQQLQKIFNEIEKEINKRKQKLNLNQNA